MKREKYFDLLLPYVLKDQTFLVAIGGGNVKVLLSGGTLEQA